MQTPTNSFAKASYSSVPLSVYRELAAELQATQAAINTLTTKNQQLTQENQLLKQEMKKAVQSVLHLQNLVETFPRDDQNQALQSTQPKRQVNQPHSFRQVFHPPSPVTPEMEILSSEPEPIFIEEEEVSYYLSNEPQTRDFSGWRFMISMLLIILMGFGVGYLIVRPFFAQHNR